MWDLRAGGYLTSTTSCDLSHVSRRNFGHNLVMSQFCGRCQPWLAFPFLVTMSVGIVNELSAIREAQLC